jgi:catechol 2,3-dioxygenase-like lactoylglutathione lyase family enzyme
MLRPVFRIFDYSKALEFYVDWLGFKVDWEHREGDSPVYLQISFCDLVLHLSEHHGDCSPGAKCLAPYQGLKEYHGELLAKNYRFNHPGLEVAPWNALCMEVIDPFGNKILFHQNLD